MPTFEYAFTVGAPRPYVTAFHQDTRTLSRLSPPPIFIQLHHFEPLAENAEASFTMWFGPVPVRWRAVHTEVGPEGFTDTQLSGPLRRWQHTHRFTAIDEGHTLVEERIRYEHAAGLRGLFTRLLFNRPALTLLFSYRRFVTRRALGEGNLGGGSIAIILVTLLLVVAWNQWRQEEASR